MIRCTRPLPLALALALSAGLVLHSHDAAAGKVVVMAVPGDDEGDLEDGLVSIVEERHDLVTPAQFERAAKRQGIEDLDGPRVGRLAKKLGADAVVEGSVSRDDEGVTFVVRVRATSGKTVKKITVELPRSRLSKKAKRRLGTGLHDGIDRVLGVASDDDAAEDEEDAEDGEEAEEERPRAKAKTKAKAKKSKRKPRPEPAIEADEDDDAEDEDAGDDGDDEDRDAGDDDDDRVAVRDDDSDIEAALGVRRDDGDEDDDDRPARKRAMPAVRLEVGPSAKMRTLSFASRDFEQAPRGYQSAMVPGARVAAEIYPLALMGDGTGAAAGLGVGVEYDQTIRLITRSSDAPDTALTTTQRHWSVQARYRIPFGKKPTSPSLTLGAGYGRRMFVVDRSGLAEGETLDMPDVDYTFFDPGAQLRLPVGSRIALAAGGKAMLFKGAGPIQEQTSYGGAKLTGFEAGGGLELKATDSILISLAGTYTVIGYAFVGNGEETNNRDLDPDSKDVGGASDVYVGAVATLGYAF